VLIAVNVSYAIKVQHKVKVRRQRKCEYMILFQFYKNAMSKHNEKTASCLKY